VVLEDDGAHAASPGQLGHVDGVDRPRAIVRQVVDVDVNRPGEQALLVGARRLLAGGANTRSYRGRDEDRGQSEHAQACHR
jgi:hypothetical protein